MRCRQPPRLLRSRLGANPFRPSFWMARAVRAYSGKYGWPSGPNWTPRARNRRFAASSWSVIVLLATSSRYEIPRWDSPWRWSSQVWSWAGVSSRWAISRMAGLITKRSSSIDSAPARLPEEKPANPIRAKAYNRKMQDGSVGLYLRSRVGGRSSQPGRPPISWGATKQRSEEPSERADSRPSDSATPETCGSARMSSSAG